MKALSKIANTERSSKSAANVDIRPSYYALTADLRIAILNKLLNIGVSKSLCNTSDGIDASIQES